MRRSDSAHPESTRLRRVRQGALPLSAWQERAEYTPDIDVIAILWAL